jgi:hypothetical protein
MLFDRLQQIRCATVVQEKDALPKAPKRCGADFVSCAIWSCSPAPILWSSKSLNGLNVTLLSPV